MSGPRPRPNERMKLPRAAMPARPAEERAHDFAEVNLGYGCDEAVAESTRCLQCHKATCIPGCPVSVKVTEFVDLVYAGDYLAAAAKVREDNVLPAITGRVCPQEEQCEGACLMGKRTAPLAIGHLERFVADWERREGRVGLPAIPPPTGRRVAIVGSGPAGLAAAGDLIQRGHEVTVYEALHRLGGVLVYGIPEFRLPKQIVDEEIDNLRKMGVRFETDVVVGRTVTVDELFAEGAHAVFLATGAGLPRFLGVPGEHLAGVYSANEFLTRVNLMGASRFPEWDEPVWDCRGKDVAVVGGGNTALDGIRTALRLGARKAHLLYRRSEKEMPARREEVHHALEEGVDMRFLVNPTAFLGDENGILRGVRLERMELGPPDDSGRRRPVRIPGSEYELDLAMAIVAVGTSANPILSSTTPDLRVERGGYISVDAGSMRTSKPGVFAGGDIVTGAATVILAMGAGRKAAASMHRWLESGVWDEAPEPVAAAAARPGATYAAV